MGCIELNWYDTASVTIISQDSATFKPKIVGG